MAAGDDAGRFEAELSLLRAMYPSEVAYDDKTRDLTFSLDEATRPKAKLCLRIPDDYPESAAPEVIEAFLDGTDFRNGVRAALQDQSLGEEVLDAVINAFQVLVARAEQTAVPDNKKDQAHLENDTAGEHKPYTVIIWLHHLLASSKRKAILDPASDSVSGISKPGYPGTLIFSGPHSAMNEHVRNLRDLQWQAFQVRAEIDLHWSFEHGTGIREVETMAEVVASFGEREEQRELFLQAMKMKT